MPPKPLYTIRRSYECDKPLRDAVDKFAKDNQMRIAEATRQLIRLGLEAANK